MFRRVILLRHNYKTLLNFYVGITVWSGNTLGITYGIVTGGKMLKKWYPDKKESMISMVKYTGYIGSCAIIGIFSAVFFPISIPFMYYKKIDLI